MNMSRTPLLWLSLAIPLAAFIQQPPTPRSGVSVGPGVTTSIRVVNAANVFLATLSDTERAKGTFAFNSSQRTGWSNLPSGVFQRNGWRFGDLTQQQRNAALALVAAALSREGIKKSPTS
jgi:hypothetical protein